MPTFDIGLVMAGAVSAGAYTAGAVDFLLEALDLWYAAKAGGDPDVPAHEVNLKVLAGASAGGLVAGILATTLGEELPPVNDYPAQTNGPANKLFDAWVNMIDIEALLRHDDLDADPRLPVRSALDSSVLDRIAARVFKAGKVRTAPRPYVADPLLAVVTLTNLRGVPYKIDFAGLTGPTIPYVMTMHADHALFAVQAPRVQERVFAAGLTTPRNATKLDPALVGQGTWLELRDASLATGAFPFGLVPRLLKRPAGSYARREWFFPRRAERDGLTECGHFGMLDPAWTYVEPTWTEASAYDYLCVDGGTMDNEPIGLARAYLTPEDKTGQMMSEGDAPGALLMIDPFPDAGDFAPKYEFPQKYTLLGLLPAVIGALLNQARFKPQELTRAMDPDVFNQFLIAPVRYDPSGKALDESALASGGLGGFGGFLSHDFRKHDFQLGRLNAQRFLRRHFVLPETLSDGRPNPLFADWTPEARVRYRLRRDADGRFVEADGKIASGAAMADPKAPVRDFLPVVPMLGRAADDEANPKWPDYSEAQLDRLETLVLDRASRVVERTVGRMGGWWSRKALALVWRLQRRSLVKDEVIGRVKADLVRRKMWRN